MGLKLSPTLLTLLESDTCSQGRNRCQELFVVLPRNIGMGADAKPAEPRDTQGKVRTLSDVSATRFSQQLYLIPGKFAREALLVAPDLIDAHYVSM